jgi:hypothetical protein
VTGGEDRPTPRYGEYATPEEVAAARGPLPDAPAEPVRVAPERTLSAARSAPVAPIRRPTRANNLITTLLLVFGIWNTVTSIPSTLDLGATLSQGLQQFGYGDITFGPAAHTAGIVLIAISFVVLLAAVGVSLRLMREGRRSIWVPLAAGALYLLASFIVMTVVVANTPGLLQVLHNH